MTVLAIDHIVMTPGVCGGKPRIDGTRVRVQDVAVLTTLHQWSAEQIAAELDITPSQVHAALSYYYDHKDEIDAQMRETDTLLEQSGAVSMDELRRRIESRQRDV